MLPSVTASHPTSTSRLLSHLRKTEEFDQGEEVMDVMEEVEELEEVEVEVLR